MTQTARGTFEETVTPQGSDDGIGRLTIDKTWSGELAGTGHGLLLSAGDQELRYDVVPGSGTGALAGIEGMLALTIDDTGQSYELTYTFG